MSNLESELAAGARAMGLELGEAAVQRLLRYQQLVLEANRSFNLTAITDPREMLVKHLLDSLSCAALPELSGRVADVGSGAGFPGAVIAAVREGCRVTLLEATNKKLEFALSACRSLGIPAAGVHGRAEELARGELRESFDSVTARAVAALPSLVEYCLPLLRVGGVAVAMKGAGWEQELQSAERAIRLLGGELLRVQTLRLPDGSERALILLRKVSPTEKRFPRGGKNIRSAPL